MMNIFEINKRIGQRPPFQMIEKVLELEPNVSARGIKNVSINEPYFMGHFPDAPIMPGWVRCKDSAAFCTPLFSATARKKRRLLKSIY